MPLADNQDLNINPAGPTKFIYSGSEHIAEAEQYFDFLTRPENMQYLIDNDPNMRTLPFPGITYNLLPNQQEFLELVPAGKTRHGVPDSGELRQSAMDGHRTGFDGHVHWRYGAA